MSIAAKRSHRGDEYQLRVAVHWLIRLLSEDDLVWIQIDSVVIPGKIDQVDVDDVVIRFKDGTITYIQAKVHQQDRRAWSMADLAKELIKVKKQVEKDPSGKFIFYSQTPFGELQKIVDDAIQFDNYKSFAVHAPNTLKKPFSDLVNTLERLEEVVFELCRRISIGPHHSLDDWDRLNREALERIVSDPDKALLILERLARKNQAGLGGSLKLTRNDV